jgi:hypothetical protein
VLLLAVDLARANAPWVVTYNWREKYASNVVLDFLREKPLNGRVAILPFRPPGQLALLDDVYRIEWAQHQFLYYNIQSLDVVQMPRPPVDMVTFEKALQFDGTSNTLHHLTRRWQLTNTRFLLGAEGFVEVLNQQIDPALRRFRPALRFELVPKPGISEPKGLDQITAVADTNGPYAVIEFTGALPRALLYSNWQVVTNDDAALAMLASKTFDPTRTALVANASAGQPAPAATSATTDPGTVEFVSYAPKDILLRAKATGPALLVLNDRYDPNWKVTVDGQPAELLRSNYLMRGVRLPAGDHQVRFVFAPPVTGLYISLAAMLIGIVLIGVVTFWKPREDSEAQT